MPEFNDNLKNGRAYKEFHPAATTEKLTHHVQHTLLVDKPDTVILNVGTNDIGDGKRTDDIAAEIVDLVNMCHDFGVIDVYVSEIIYRPRKGKQVNELNNYLRARTYIDDFYLINHRNIDSRHIAKDDLHLNYNGVCQLANNFLTTLNGKRSQ